MAWSSRAAAKLTSPRLQGDIKVVCEDWAEYWKPENAKRIVNAASTEIVGKLDAVLASSDGTAS